MATIRRLRGRWQAQVRRKGMKPRARSFDSNTEAERWARDLEAEVDRTGLLPDTRVADSMTLGDVLRRYQREVTSQKRGASAEHYRINLILRAPIAYRTMTLLSSGDIAAYRDQRLKKVAGSTVLKEIIVVSHAIDIARREWGVHLRENPCRLVRRPSPPKGRDRRLKGDEERRLLEAADGGRVTYMRPLIILAIETAMRRGELLSLTWFNIDLERQIAHLPLTKNGEPRDVPLSTRAVEILSELRLVEGNDRVFPVSGHAVEQAWQHLRCRAGSQDLRFHDLRHEGVSRLFEKGLNIIEVGSISGHKELAMLKRYTHLRATDLVAKLG